MREGRSKVIVAFFQISLLSSPLFLAHPKRTKHHFLSTQTPILCSKRKKRIKMSQVEISTVRKLNPSLHQGHITKKHNNRNEVLKLRVWEEVRLCSTMRGQPCLNLIEYGFPRVFFYKSPNLWWQNGREGTLCRDKSYSAITRVSMRVFLFSRPMRKSQVIVLCTS